VHFPLTISSLQNPRIKAAIRLRDRRGRESSGRMLVEGFHELALAWESGLRPLELFVCPELVRPTQDSLRFEMEAAGTPVLEVTKAVMTKLAYRENPDGWLAVAEIPQKGLDDLQLDSSPLLVIAEAVEKPGNLGAILRSADAAGADAVIICDRTTDIYNPNVVRSSKGTVFQVPVVEAGSAETVAWLKERQIKLVAATPAAEEAHWEVDLRGGVAIAVGTENEGLSPFILEEADLRVAIPMRGRVNSLNVAQALTVLVYEAQRQRQGSGDRR
jgi:RNA methyltransferase, TrmH family